MLCYVQYHEYVSVLQHQVVKRDVAIWNFVIVYIMASTSIFHRADDDFD